MSRLIEGRFRRVIAPLYMPEAFGRQRTSGRLLPKLILAKSNRVRVPKKALQDCTFLQSGGASPGESGL